MIRAGRMRAIHDIAEFTLEAASAQAFTTRTFSVARTIRYFTFIVFQTAFTAFPSWIALTLAVDVVTTTTAEYWTNTFTAIVPAETGFALASAQDAFAIAVTSSWAAESHVTGQRDETGGLLRISIIVVKRNEPMARFHVMQYFLLYQRRGSTSSSALVATDDVQHVVVGVRWQGVPASVESETSTAG